MIQEQKWWKEAVGYQIYPASFKDSNGDGQGLLSAFVELYFIIDNGQSIESFAWEIHLGQ